MNLLKEKRVQCPYCGENIDILIDCSVSEQDYIEDCQVCCRPITINVSIAGDDDILVDVKHQDE